MPNNSNKLSSKTKALYTRRKQGTSSGYTCGVFGKSEALSTIIAFEESRYLYTYIDDFTYIPFGRNEVPRRYG